MDVLLLAFGMELYGIKAKTAIFSLDIKFSVVSSLLIYYALAFFSVLSLLNYMPFVGLHGLQIVTRDSAPT